MTYVFQECEKWPKAPDSDDHLDVLRGNEYLVVCPYDKSHRALSTKFSNHLMKCRRNYKDALLEADEDVLLVSCRYCRRKVLPPELECHEFVCQQDYVEGTALVDIIYNHELKRHKGLWHTWEPNVYAMAVFELLEKIPGPAALVPEAVVLWADPEQLRPMIQGKSTLGNDEPSSWSLKKRKSRRKSRLMDRIGFPSEDRDKMLEFLYWNSPGSGPRFDWLQNFMHSTVPNHIVPSGMAKHHRKMWTDYNTHRLKTEKGFFVQEEKDVQVDSAVVVGHYQ